MGERIGPNEPILVYLIDEDGITQYVRSYIRIDFGHVVQYDFDLTTDLSQARRFEGTSAAHSIRSNNPEFHYKRALTP